MGGRPVPADGLLANRCKRGEHEEKDKVRNLDKYELKTKKDQDNIVRLLLAVSGYLFVCQSELSVGILPQMKSQ
jgi:hypothetical protein